MRTFLLAVLALGVGLGLRALADKPEHGDSTQTYSGHPVVEDTGADEGGAKLPPEPVENEVVDTEGLNKELETLFKTSDALVRGPETARALWDTRPGETANP